MASQKPLYKVVYNVVEPATRINTIVKERLAFSRDNPQANPGVSRVQGSGCATNVERGLIM